MSAPLLDHVSVAAERAWVEDAGFALTPTSGADGHARVFLDRSYLEVVAGDRGEPAARGWFLRPDDLEEAATTLRAAGLSTSGPARYEGTDGTWLDLALADEASPALPTLTRRVDPVGEWPPPLRTPHPNGAVRLVEVHLRVGNPAPLVPMLEALGAQREGESKLGLGAGGRVVIETTDRATEGIAAIVLARVDGRPLTLSFPSA